MKPFNATKMPNMMVKDVQLMVYKRSSVVSKSVPPSNNVPLLLKLLYIPIEQTIIGTENHSGPTACGLLAQNPVLHQ